MTLETPTSGPVVPSDSRADRIVDAAPEPVRFSDRLSAFVVDLLLLAALQFVVTFVLSRVLQAAGMRSVAGCPADPEVLCEGPSTAAWVIVALAFVAATIGYHAVFEGRFGATPGKRAAGLRVVDASRSDQPIGIVSGVARALVRQLFWWALLIVFATSSSEGSSTGMALWFAGGLAFGLISWVSAAISPTGSSLHDSIARSRVVPAASNAATESHQAVAVDNAHAAQTDHARDEEE